MENSYLFMIGILAILGGFVTGQLWISIIFALAIFLIISFGDSKEMKKPEAVPMPLVRPVIVKRQYVGPKSIYPEKMQIDYNPKNPPGKWKGKSKTVGGAIGSGLRWLFNRDE